MNKQAFLSALRKGLTGLPKDDIDHSIEFYSEMLDDRIEEGMSEEEAAASVGNIDDIVSQILSETSLTKLVKAKVKPNRALRIWEIILLVLGSLIWLPLLLAVIVVIFAVYIVIWSVVVCVYAVDVSLAAGGIAGFVGLFVYYAAGNIAGGLMFAGAGFTCIGLSILLFFASNQIAKGILFLSGKIIGWIKSLFIKREGVL